MIRNVVSIIISLRSPRIMESLEPSVFSVFFVDEVPFFQSVLVKHIF